MTRSEVVWSQAPVSFAARTVAWLSTKAAFEEKKHQPWLQGSGTGSSR